MMKRKSIFSLAGAGLSALLLMGTGCGRAPESAEITRLRFADTGIDGLEELRRAFGEFVSVMEELTGLEVAFFPVADRTIAAAALEAGDVDIVLAGPTEYLFIRSRLDVELIAGIERAEYFSVVIVPVDSPAQSLTDLRGKTIAFKDPGSTSGHVVPTAMFLDAGMVEGRDYQGPLVDRLRFEMMFARDAYAMVGGIRDFRRVEEQRPGQFRILAQSETLPRDVIVARPGLPPEVIETLREQMIANGERIMDAILSPGERNKYLGARIVEIADSDYDQMRETHRILNLPFDQ
jgi:phosphonate transport system substrate-binding protein